MALVYLVLTIERNTGNLQTGIPRGVMSSIADSQMFFMIGLVR
jgi:hypothetical protein